MLEYVLGKRDAQRRTLRVGIAGPPGAGKSTFIESLGRHILGSDEKKKLAVLAIDPSSSRSGGSILGDKTRMDVLSQHPQAFVRPSPSSGKLGGIAEHTNDVILLCESAGFDLVLVETVGLGQSEILIDEVVDVVVVVTPPQMGDELQGIKRGLLEIADMIVVNKCDGELKDAGDHAASQYTHTFHMLRRKHKEWRPRVKKVSALNNIGVDEVWKVLQEFSSSMETVIEERRRKQSVKMMWSGVFDEIERRVKYNKQIQEIAAELTPSLSKGIVTPRKAAADIVDLFLKVSS